MVDQLKVFDKLITATLLTIAVSLFFGISNKPKPAMTFDAAQVNAPGQLLSQVISSHP